MRRRANESKSLAVRSLARIEICLASTHTRGCGAGETKRTLECCGVASLHSTSRYRTVVLLHTALYRIRILPSIRLLRIQLGELEKQRTLKLNMPQLTPFMYICTRRVREKVNRYTKLQKLYHSVHAQAQKSIYSYQVHQTTLGS